MLVLGAIAGTAEAKTKVFSSGNINQPIPDPAGGSGTEIAPSFKVKTRGTVKDVNVAVRISHPDARELEIGASHIPAKGVLREVRLKEVGQLSEPKGVDFGAGAAGCQGAIFTVFDSQASTPIFGATPPFAGSFLPASSLRPLNGPLQGKWFLDLVDSAPGDAGVLNCWQIIVRYKPEKKRQR
jgi:subtilisin-like proprotein convertase family protein